MAAKKSSTKRTPEQPSGKPLVIVESPAKARTISKFLGGEFEVQASIGHVRDLPSRSADLPPNLKGSKYGRLGVDLDNNFEPIYVVPSEKRDQIKMLRELLKEAPELLLATDEDREGESISWHLMEVLKPKVPVRRLVFHEITKSAIQKALDNARAIDDDLVRAQESRRILDRLFGYEISPVLWRKIRPRLSAGRVQSVALRLLVERELARMAFVPSEYWDLAAEMAPAKDKQAVFPAALRKWQGKPLATGKDFDPNTGKLKNEKAVVLTEATAKQLAEDLRTQTARVADVEEKPYSQKPSPPFTTSTLQQEAGRKLRFGAQRTMRLAQKLYENGCITYMRTDSTILSGEAIDAARELIGRQYGNDYLPTKPRTYKTKVKNAQEAHEAIRPAGSSFKPIDAVRKEFGADAGKLYELIWKRTVASQMNDAKGMRVRVRIEIGEALFHASGKTITFPGFQRAYVEGSDDPLAELADQEKILPPLAVGDEVHTKSLEAKGHTTFPPARFTEASLVKELDTRGIGRPSTWASIIALLLTREYAFRKGSALCPSFTAFAVINMLKQNFGQVLDYDFTANMEDDLDAISRGELDGREYLRKFYLGNGTPGLQQLVQDGIDNVDPRKVCGIALGATDDGRKIELRVGRYGLFVTDGEHNASIPDDIVPDELELKQAIEFIEVAKRGPVPLGEDPETKLPVYVKNGRFGPYVQRGDMVEGGEKPKMVSLLDGMAPDAVDLATALRLLELPRNLGRHPKAPEGEDDPAKTDIFAHLGRYGPYIKWDAETRSIPADISILDITNAQAVELLSQPRRRRGQRAPAKPLKELGEHPESGAPVKILPGRFGPYVTDGDVNASVPKDMEPSEVTMDDAIVLLQKRRERIKAQGGRTRRKKKKKASRKKKAKKKASKKRTAKKKARKASGKKKKKAARKKSAD